MFQIVIQQNTAIVGWEITYDVVWWCAIVRENTAIYEHLFLLSGAPGVRSDRNVRGRDCH